MRIDNGVSKSKMVRTLKKADSRINSSLYDKYEEYVALPTPKQMQAICEVLKVEPLDIYSKEEITLNKPQNANRTNENAREPESYKLTVLLPAEAREWLNKEVLNKCGYRSITHWITVCYERLQKQYGHITNGANEKKPTKTDFGIGLDKIALEYLRAAQCLK